MTKKVIGWVLFGVLLLAWFVELRPAFLGGSATYVMVSGSSMEPGLHDGDFIVASKADEYDVGDVIAFKIPEGDAGAGSMVIHRVIGGNGETGYRTQGDNRPEQDLWTPTDADVQGERMFLIPKAGVVVTALRSPLVIALVAGALVFLVVALDRSKKEDQTELAGIPDVG
jgi:signal peptidase